MGERPPFFLIFGGATGCRGDLVWRRPEQEQDLAGSVLKEKRIDMDLAGSVWKEKRIDMDVLWVLSHSFVQEVTVGHSATATGPEGEGVRGTSVPGPHCQIEVGPGYG
ncbi:hypothetical protein NDU88_007237 [Pleurodeles waltl]|uniref:Uncharacterized protein n=1 Tax=Pleurodeles waltl TaxID=8319 RepID=A0AAV7QRA4_PLEWA|nr:hypothetical protein NDU88_007237 [Pleurodeles waltl]